MAARNDAGWLASYARRAADDGGRKPVSLAKNSVVFYMYTARKSTLYCIQSRNQLTRKTDSDVFVKI